MPPVHTRASSVAFRSAVHLTWTLLRPSAGISVAEADARMEKLRLSQVVSGFIWDARIEKMVISEEIFSRLGLGTWWPEKPAFSRGLEILAGEIPAL